MILLPRQNSRQQPVAIYDRIAPRYDLMHQRFLRLAGGEAQAVFEAACLMIARPGLRVLDAGCGTGEVARRLLEREPDVDMTLLDASAPMLRRTQGLAARRVHGSLAALPFTDGAFDLSFAAWVLETLVDPDRAVHELVRVIQPHGHVLLAFCCPPEAGDVPGRAMIAAMQLRGTGTPIDADAILATLHRAGCRRIIRLPCRGPATVLLAQKVEIR